MSVAWRLAPVFAVLVSCQAIIDAKDHHYVQDDVSPPGQRVEPAAACGDLRIDPNNCGQCGHGCLGGRCVEGQCQPVAIAENVSAWGLGVDDKHVYWTEPFVARIVRANRDGSDVVTLASGVPRSNLPWDLAVDDAYVYWGSADQVLFRCKIGGCANAPTVLGETPRPPKFLMVDATHLYWVTDHDGDATVQRMPKEGGPVQALIRPGELGQVNSIALDDDDVYTATSSGKIWRMPKVGGAPVELGTVPRPVVDVVVTPSSVYAAQGASPGSLHALSKNGSTGFSALLSGIATPIAIAADDRTLYFLAQAGTRVQKQGALMACPLSGCDHPTRLVEALPDPTQLVVTDDAIYWTTFALGERSGSVMKMAKPLR